MAKNKIQFQKGLSLTDFLSTYGTEEQCYAQVFKMRWPHGYICSRCGCKNYCYISSRKVYQCNSCHTQQSAISKTIFASSKLPLTVWFLAIYFITQSKDGISSLQLARTIGTSANAALRIKHKLQQVMKEKDDSRPLQNLVLLDDAYWGGRKRDGKRGRAATNQTPFVAALQLSKEKHPLFIKFNKVSGFTKAEITQWASKHIRSTSYVLSDGLNCFPGVEDAGSRHIPIVATTFEDINRRIFKWLNTVIGNVKNAMHGVYHAIHKKHLPRYLAEFCYRFNRRFNLKTITTALIRDAVATPPMPQRLLKLAEVRW